ncbi:NADP-dependent oxidoreductase domain-containing protein [Mycena leptocephala]|nr:NADP-dependent oxidoreductase domain-containing protein [Mycena leptocephala]
MSTFPTRQLGRGGPKVGALGLRAMGLGGEFYGGADEKGVLEMLSRAADSGINFWDTADVYGASEATIGQWFRSTGRRGEIFLSTKFGGKDLTENGEDIWRPNSQPSYIEKQLQKSLALLDPNPDGTDEAGRVKSSINLYFQHRVNPDTPIEVVMETLRPFIENGQVEYLGLSDCGIDELRRAKAVPLVGEKVVAVQVEFSPFDLESETSEFVSGARELGLTIIPYSTWTQFAGSIIWPATKAYCSHRYKSRADFEPSDVRLFMPRFDEANFAANLNLVHEFEAFAKKYNATSTQVALAWILGSYPDFIPIPGTRSAVRVEENARALDLKLSAEDLKGLAVRTADVKGGKLPPGFVTHTSSVSMSDWKGETQRLKKE